MFTPGANTSTQVPKFENDARTSVLLGRTDRQSAGQARRRVVARVRVRVAGGDHVADAVVDRVLDCGVERKACASAEAHVRDGRLPGGVVTGDPVDALDDLGVRAAALAVEHTDGDESYELCDTVGRGTNRATDVRSVPVAVTGRAAVDGIETADGAPAVFDVRQAHARVEDVRLQSGARRAVRVLVVEREVVLVDPVQSPRRWALGSRDRHRAVGLDEANVRQTGDRDRLRRRHRRCVALQRVLIDVRRRYACDRGSLRRRAGGALQNHDVGLERRGSRDRSSDPCNQRRAQHGKGQHERSRSHQRFPPSEYTGDVAFYQILMSASVVLRSTPIRRRSTGPSTQSRFNWPSISTAQP